MYAIRPLTLAALAAATAVAGVLFAPPAVAAPVSATTSTITLPASVAPLGAQYILPVVKGFVITLNTTVVVPGGAVCFVTHGNVPGRQFTITVLPGAMNVGTFTADANGDVRGCVNTAGFVLGEYQLRVVAIDTGETQIVTFTVVAAQASVIPPGNSTSSGGDLAFTGANAVVPLTTLGVVLLLGGGAAVFVSRRRPDDVA